MFFHWPLITPHRFSDWSGVYKAKLFCANPKRFLVRLCPCTRSVFYGGLASHRRIPLFGTAHSRCSSLVNRPKLAKTGKAARSTTQFVWICIRDKPANCVIATLCNQRLGRPIQRNPIRTFKILLQNVNNTQRPFSIWTFISVIGRVRSVQV